MVITLKDIQMDLSEIGFNFDLNDQQINALTELAEFLEDDAETAITLQGSAGTGKTTIVKVFLSYLEKRNDRKLFEWRRDNKSKYPPMTLEIGYELTAPTHKARMVLQRLAGDNTSTIHSLLALRPNIDILELDMLDLDFISSSAEPTIPYGGVLIIDEASMINDNLYELILERCESKFCKVLFIGDIAQLQPVKQGDTSRVFDDTKQVCLTKVERQKGENPLLDVLLVARDRTVEKFETCMTEGGTGIVTYNNVKSFASKIKQDMTFESIINSPFKSKILCYTNKRVSDYNTLVRRILGFKQEFCVGDMLMAYDNYAKILMNSCDYMVTDAIVQTRDLPFIGPVKGWFLEVLDLSMDDMHHDVFVLTPELTTQKKLNQIATMIENLRVNAVKAKHNWARKEAWKQYYSLYEHFTTTVDLLHANRVIKKKTLDYGYAITIHKSQGSTYDQIFLDVPDINKCQDANELRQLQYVGLSRPKKIAHLLI